MSNKLNQLIQLLKGYLGIFSGIGFGLFLFVLFFQPLPLDRLDFNDRLIFIAVLAGIVFFMMTFIRILFSGLLQTPFEASEQSAIWNFLMGFSLFILSAVALAFYIRYVGGLRVTFHIMLKIILISLVAPVIIRLYDIIGQLKNNNRLLLQEKKALLKIIETYKDHYLEESVAFASETGSDLLKLQLSEVAFIRSADNYVEICYREGNVMKNKLIRNTLKAVENQLKPYPNFIRCHRICIVNIHFVEKLFKHHDHYLISLKDSAEKLPVSRQYLLKIKEVL